MSYQLTKQITGMCRDITNVKDILLHGAASGNNEQPCLTDMK